MSDLIFGIHPVQEALRAGRRESMRLVVADRNDRRIADIIKLAERARVPVDQLDRQQLDKRCGAGAHQGVALQSAGYPYLDLEDAIENWRSKGGAGFFLALDGVTDPHNYGAILRSADAAGCRTIIVPKDNSSPVNAVVIKTSAGAAEHLSIVQVVNLARALDQLKDAGCWIYGLADGGDSSIYQADLCGDIVLVAGNEGSGIRRNVLARCDHRVAIPMAGGVSSLNVSVATAVALFEGVRQRSAGEKK